MDKVSRAKMDAVTAIAGSLDHLMLDALGDRLAEEQNHSLLGLDAVQYYLIQKHNWLPQDVRSMSIADLKLACAKEIEALPRSVYADATNEVMKAVQFIRPID